MDEEAGTVNHSVVSGFGDDDPDPDQRNKKNHSVEDLGHHQKVEPELLMVGKLDAS